ncbi:MAG: putative porin, partial [Verrucomicrobiota bacterium]
MNKKTIYSIVLGIAVSAASIFAVEDAAALRTELDALNKRLEELEKGNASSEKSSWTDKIKVKGDVRARFEHREKDNETDKSRFRGRARVGVYADVNDQVYAGVRIATGSDDSPTSTNQSLEDFGEKRTIWLDLMYMGYTPEAIKGLDLILGKIKQPWEQVSDLMYDSDVNPEGLNMGYSKAFDSFELIA